MIKRLAFVLAWLLATPVAPAGLVEVIVAAKPSIVAVGTFNEMNSPRFGFRGTGFVVSNGKRVVTNAHVLPGPQDPAAGARLMILLPRGPDGPETRAATVASLDPVHDLALLEIEGTALPPLALAPAGVIREGLSVALIGFPLGTGLGFTPVTHRGIVSAITAIALPSPSSRQLDAKTASRLRQGSFDVYQLDATAYPGNSGSPVIDVDSGSVVGVVNMVLVKGTKESALTHPSGISYAVPVRYVDELISAR